MRLILSMSIIVLIGCGSVDDYVMLDTAPTSDSQLRYPQWAGNVYTAPMAFDHKESDEMELLTEFMDQHGIRYQTVSGEHIMVKLESAVSFFHGSSVVSSGQQIWLNKLGTYLSNYSNIDIVLDGHTDNTGEEIANQVLSQKRALRVKSELLKSSLLSGQIFTRGYGDYMPACGNNTKSGRACNRRVELTLIISKP